VSDRCTWCGDTVGDAYRVYEGPRRAVFCRLEHVVPWAIRGAAWEPGEPVEGDARVITCSWCDQELDDRHVLLVRSRGEVSVHDGFCGVAHLLEWAKAGGRYR
jgi:hypothetical protein